MIPLAEERCDACNAARAYVRTIIVPDGPLSLTWCAHCFARHEFELMAGKYPVIDHRYELQTPAKPKARQ